MKLNFRPKLFDTLHGYGRAAFVGDLSAGITVGVLALQGGVREHVRLLESLGARTALLRVPSDLSGPDGPRVDALVLPGGESSTIDRLLRLFGLQEPLADAIRGGTPTLGTCAGLILCGTTISGPEQKVVPLRLMEY